LDLFSTLESENVIRAVAAQKHFDRSGTDLRPTNFVGYPLARYSLGVKTFIQIGRVPMKIASTIAIATLLATSAASAQMMSSVPSSSKTVSDWYKQDVYDPSNSKIGKIDDVLVSDSGQIDALIVGVGGFLGAGEKDVAVPFNAVT
jgi:sporulation protein YlmC with PRC-barrel domain